MVPNDGASRLGGLTVWKSEDMATEATALSCAALIERVRSPWP